MTSISHDAQYDNGHLSYLFLSVFGPDPHQMHFAVGFSSYIPPLQMSLTQVHQQNFPNSAGSGLISSKKGMADDFCSLTSMYFSCSLSLTNRVDMLVARVFAKAASCKRVLETI